MRYTLGVENMRYIRWETFPLISHDRFHSIFAVDREQRVSAEELVLSGASRNPRLRALHRGHTHQSGPCPLQPERRLLQLPQEQRSVSQRRRAMLCMSFQSTGGTFTVLSLSTAMSHWTDTEARTHAQTKHLAHTGISAISLSARELILCPAALFVFHREHRFVFFSTRHPLTTVHLAVRTKKISQHSCE